MPLIPGGEVGITDPKRRAIYEAEKAAAAMGVLPDDPEKRRVIIERLGARLARARRGWDFNAMETVTRVDERGVAHIIPKSDAVGWMRDEHGNPLPAHPDARDASSGTAQVGRTTPYTERMAFPDPGPIPRADPREAAARFYARIRAEMEQHGYIPGPLRQELHAEGWKLGQPVPLATLEEWCNRFTAENAAKYPRG